MRMLRSSSVVRTMGGRRSYMRLSLNLGKMRFGISVSTAPEQALSACQLVTLTLPVECAACK